jgi:hypothetical protein
MLFEAEFWPRVVVSFLIDFNGVLFVDILLPLLPVCLQMLR